MPRKSRNGPAAAAISIRKPSRRACSHSKGIDDARAMIPAPPVLSLRARDCP